MDELAMIHWLIQSLDDCPEILCSDRAPEWLCEEEHLQLGAFKVEKRRRDWLLGRWTAKRLVQSYLAGATDERAPLDALCIGNDADGAPYASAERCVSSAQRTDAQQRLPLSLSISHSHGVAFCALVACDDAAAPHGAYPSLGCDLEQIEAREASFVQDFFCTEEIAAVRQMEADARPGLDVLVTAVWSVKEAVLKAMREGLRVDTRYIMCRVDDPSARPREWTQLHVALESRLAARFPGAWSVWWRVYDDFVLTLALREPSEA